MSADSPSDRPDRELANGETRTVVSAAARGDGDAGRGDTDEATPDRVEVADLRRENARLRQRYEALRRGRYRQTATALAALGVAGLLGGAVFPPVRETLVVLGAIGLFAAAVTRYLSPERFIPVGVGSSVFGAHASNHAAVVDELGLQDTMVYVPDAGRDAVRLFVPEHRGYALPDAEALRDTFVVSDDELARGVAFNPSGGGLFDEFERSLDGPLGDDPETLARQATDALVELFELAETATAETDAADGRLTVRVEDCRFGSAETFDTPVASFVAVAVAHGLDAPVVAEVAAGEEMDFAVTCRWDVEDDKIESPASAASEAESEAEESVTGETEAEDAEAEAEADERR
ncbi:hypothetical protein C457_15327 [Haloferax prahovense DSM 18310]|uniref:DUF7982 domain-containing protein n=1 Tax=Haloferax prahovense (strain DSM 18310 / JCM 13924 / TL6) TaxID=1227461 RepID=M0G300_HALPT|nr:hypothetical protein [Haloferax prahovense]ELZ65942.1 hypothetical protein C457_15327 [Haloferax prahovense DSM 18310]